MIKRIDGSCFLLMLLGSAQRTPMFLTVSSTYVSPHGCKFKSFTLNNSFTFHVIHFIATSNFSFVNWLNFVMKCFDVVSFISKYGTSINKNGFFRWYYERYIIFRWHVEIIYNTIFIFNSSGFCRVYKIQNIDFVELASLDLIFCDSTNDNRSIAFIINVLHVTY